MPADRDEQRLKRITQAGRFRQTDLRLRGRAILVDTARHALVWSDTTYPLDAEECSALNRQSMAEEKDWDLAGPRLTNVEARLLERVRWWQRQGHPCRETGDQLAVAIECGRSYLEVALRSLCARGILVKRIERRGRGQRRSISTTERGND